MMAVAGKTVAAGGAGLVLLTLASGQFLMTLDSSVMNVSIATVASDLNTTVSGIQSAITLYTLVMATLMITGGKIGANIGRRRAFSIGCIIYGIGSLTTALAPNLGILLLGWSLLEGIGAALIMPAIVALVAINVAPAGRARAYGLIAAAGAVAVAVGPLIGGAVTTLASWRYVFAGEVIVVIVIFFLARRIEDIPPTAQPPLDYVGSILSILGLGMLVFGVLRSSAWGWVTPKQDAPQFFGVSLTLWLILLGLLTLWALLAWESRLERQGREPLFRPSMFRNRQMVGGLTMFLFQYFIQAGVFFTIPLFLSVVLELSAFETGLRLVPLSLALLVAALGVPRLWPNASPRLVVRLGLLLLLAATIVLIGALDARGHRQRRHDPAAADGPGHRRAGLTAGRGDSLGGSRRAKLRGGWPAKHCAQCRRVARHGAGRLDPDRDTQRALPAGNRGASQMFRRA